FQGKISSCLVNPKACFETELTLEATAQPKNIAVVGAGPAGLSAALALDERGHRVTLIDKAGQIGGQLNLARQVPGKEEFHGLVNWFTTLVDKSGIDLRLGAEATPETLAGFDEIVLATGVIPRDTGIEGQDGPNVLSYIEVLSGAPVGDRVAVVGAGGIGFDVAEFLTQKGDSPTLHPEEWRAEWGVTDPETARGGLADPKPEPAARQVTLLQRKAEKPGRRLGKTTGWIHRATLQAKGVKMIGGVNYERIDSDGLHISFGSERREPQLLVVDTVVLCAGQESLRNLAVPLTQAGKTVHIIGGADVAAELDAKRAIDQGTRLAATM
ncbi:MAG: FAD/NAD(P)-binding oxidoreductase, partial [Albidovulum sp.]|uniref:FAD-dependent oxidoreductase n=1 Tax=Albidovulum sp. TaxID=1872424 RepID=UPI003C881BA6